RGAHSRARQRPSRLCRLRGYWRRSPARNQSYGWRQRSRRDHQRRACPVSRRRAHLGAWLSTSRSRRSRLRSPDRRAERNRTHTSVQSVSESTKPMAEKEKRPEFVVTDRRLFSDDGELRHDVVEAEERRAEREQENRDAQRRANEERAAQNHPAEPPVQAVATPDD